MKNFTIAILASGNATDGPAIIEMCKKEGINLACIFSNKPDNGALQKAKDFGIEGIYLDPIGKTREDYDMETVQILKDRNVDLVCLVGYMRIVSPYFVNEFKDRILNVHPSLLPKYTGMMGDDIHAKVIENKDKITGMTIHIVDEGVDTGEILLQKSVEVSEDETVETLRTKVQNLEKIGYPEAVKIMRERIVNSQ